MNRDHRDHYIATAQVEAQNHQPENGGGCTCGFCAWSVEHVLVMSMRHALNGARLRPRPTVADLLTDDDEPSAPQPTPLARPSSLRGGVIPRRA